MAPSSTTPLAIPDSTIKTGELYGTYLQDEWLVSKVLTLNYGLRYDISNGFERESQVSPRVNAVYILDDATKLHVGYSLRPGHKKKKEHLRAAIPYTLSSRLTMAKRRDSSPVPGSVTTRVAATSNCV